MHPTDVKVAFIAAGSSAAHCIVGGVNGVCYTWGRNERGQLGHGDLLQRNTPTVVAGLQGQHVVAACGGKHHTVVVTRDGHSFSFGLNSQGQLGIGSIKKTKATPEDLQLAPVKALMDNAATVSCGADFTAWLTKTGQVWTAGNPQYGQLGGGTDHMYNAKDTSIKIMYEPQPTPRAVEGLLGSGPCAVAVAVKQVRVKQVVCGHSHSLALAEGGAAYTWGNGNYGKLGHKVQQDEMKPRLIESFRGRMLAVPDAVCGAGGTSTFCVATGPQLYAWGKLKVSGDSTTHPMPLEDLSGWNLRSLSCGPGTYAVAADSSVITWGAATNGELGYGPQGKKSSARPDKCTALEGMHTHQVACGVGFTLFLTEAKADQLAKFPVHEPSVAVEEAKGGNDNEAAAAGSSKAAAGKGAGAKRKGAAGAGGKGKKAK
ncbi:RCC1/BLIP-II [Scenedesmus sp. NREL 46B-D3]|nr:RCC1/BLIP-II [Scenedesmus sp. NREL 46B-D3]